MLKESLRVASLQTLRVRAFQDSLGWNCERMTRNLQMSDLVLGNSIKGSFCHAVMTVLLFPAETQY